MLPKALFFGGPKDGFECVLPPTRVVRFPQYDEAGFFRGEAVYVRRDYLFSGKTFDGLNLYVLEGLSLRAVGGPEIEWVGVKRG